MNTATKRVQLHQLIDEIEDEKIEAFYTLFSNELDTEEHRKKLIQAEREKYLSGDHKSFSPEEVREMAMNKSQRHVL